MSTLLQNPLWNELDKLVTQIDAEALARQHLLECQHKIRGYWHGDERYDEIEFISPPQPELVSISVRTTVDQKRKSRSLNMTFSLKGNKTDQLDELDISVDDDEDDDEFGELSLVVNENLDFVDENWFIDVDSPFVVAKHG